MDKEELYLDFSDKNVRIVLAVLFAGLLMIFGRMLISPSPETYEQERNERSESGESEEEKENMEYVEDDEDDSSDSEDDDSSDSEDSDFEDEDSEGEGEGVNKGSRKWTRGRYIRNNRRRG